MDRSIEEIIDKKADFLDMAINNISDISVLPRILA